MIFCLLLSRVRSANTDAKSYGEFAWFFLRALERSFQSACNRVVEKECGGLIGWFIPRAPLPLRALPSTPSLALGVRSGAGVTWYLDGDHVVLLTTAGGGLWGVQGPA